MSKLIYWGDSLKIMEGNSNNANHAENKCKSLILNDSTATAAEMTEANQNEKQIINDLAKALSEYTEEDWK